MAPSKNKTVIKRIGVRVDAATHAKYKVMCAKLRTSMDERLQGHLRADLAYHQKRGKP
jgi:hypothetical protein